LVPGSWHAICKTRLVPTKPLHIAIIGSGLAGGALADRLAGHHAVTIFERGSEGPARPPQPAMTSRHFGLYPSFAYGLGGTTNFWHGGLVDMLSEEMGAAWPDSLKVALPQYYSGVVRQLYGEAMLKVWREREKARLTDGVLPTRLLYPATPFRATASGFLKLGSLRINHRVERVVERAGGVDVVSRVAGEERVDHFDRVVIAAGGLNSSVLVRNSGIGGSAAGDNFTDHPMGFVAKLRATPSVEFSRLRRKNPLFRNSQAMLKVRDAQTGLWSAFYLRPCFGADFASDPYKRSFEFLAERRRANKYLAALPHLADPDFLYQALENQLHVPLPSGHAYVLVVNEQEAMGQGRVRGDADGHLTVDWQISDAVEGALRRNLSRLADCTGADLILPDGSLRDRLWSAAHHSGTCRISPSAATGVVDENLRVHDTKHIYVCDGSVLPSTGASNTGLTIAALAHRLAEHLRDKSSRRGTSRSRKRLLVSGITGAVGQMLRARLAGLDFDWSETDLRSDVGGIDGPAKGGVLLHLANAHNSVEENIRLQERAALLADREGITEIIVPMSASTIESLGPFGPRADAENFGFKVSQSDPYPSGKLAAERFWFGWQTAKPGRRVAFVYIPTIIGPRSKWTNQIAKHAPDSKLIVPRLDRFLAVKETDLIDLFAKLAREGIPAGVTRHFALSSSQALTQAIMADRGGKTKEVNLPGLVWSLLALSYRNRVLQKALSVVRVMTDRVLRRTLGYALLPISPRYLHLFRVQSDMADAIEASVRETRPDRRERANIEAGAPVAIP
jgi:nucleoside-diphosphate-sugar epimerase